MNNQVVVYTAGAYDMFHVGHLNLLKMAKGLGDKLIVGVSTDEVLNEYKPNKLVMGFEDRIQIVSAIRYVDVCVPQRSRDKFAAWEKLQYDILAVGDDWKGKPDFIVFEEKLAAVGVKTVYLPYTESISSTKLRNQINWSRS